MALFSIPDRRVRYRDLRIDLYSDEGDRFVTVAHGGRTMAMVRTEHNLYVQSRDLRAALSATSTDPGLAPQRGLAAAKPIKDIGARLFSSLFESGLDSVREREREQARRDGLGLQLRLGFSSSDAAIAALPWEWMLDTWQGEFVSLLDQETITRTMYDSGSPVLVELPDELRMLIVSYSDGSLAIEREVDAIRTAFAARTAMADPVILHAANPDRGELVERLQEVRPTVLHYCGSGLEDSTGPSIALAGPGSERFDRIPPAGLVEILQRCHMPQIVVLNACTTSSFAFAIAPHVQAVVALTGLVPDDAAVELASLLYASLARGAAIDAALATARQELAIRSERDLGVPSWAAPVLYYRGAAPVVVSDERTVLEATTPSPSSDPSESRERRKLELRRQTLERNQREIDKRIAALAAGKVPPELEAQRRDVANALAKLAEELDR